MLFILVSVGSIMLASNTRCVYLFSLIYFYLVDLVYIKSCYALTSIVGENSGQGFVQFHGKASPLTVGYLLMNSAFLCELLDLQALLATLGVRV